MKKTTILLTLLLVLVHCNEPPSSDPSAPDKKGDPTAENQQQGQPVSQNQGTQPDVSSPQEGTPPPQNTAPLQEITPPQTIDTTCIAGAYSGTGDIRWNFLSFDQNLVVSIAFQGNSALVKVNGADNDLLCTLYENLSATTKANGITVLSADRIVSSRTEGNAFYSDTLAHSLLDIQISSENCDFNIGSTTFKRINRNREDDTLNSENLKRATDQLPDFNTLLAECGGLEYFTISPL
ncbi:MAG: hypothetical protein OXK80_06000 [Bdellovibrionales bacterium]|nr:hypothetical protein [Bdellovibrionales bacterium]